MNIVDPNVMQVQGVNGMSENLHVSLFKFVLVNGDATKLGGANRRKVSRMREQKAPTAKIAFSTFFTCLLINLRFAQPVKKGY